MLLIYSVILILCILIVIQTTFFFLSVLSAKIYDPNEMTSCSEGTAVILIPAHNEERVILKTLESVKKELPSGDKVLVVADNCTDNTASIVKVFSKENKAFSVIERSNKNNRGKGFALDFGIKYLANSKPDIIILVDADCTLGEDALLLLKNNSLITNKPTQANYIIEGKQSGSILSKISTFALVIKNIVRQAGTKALGLPCILVGSGMAIPWKALNSINLATGNIVEDMQMGIDLSINGFEPKYCGKAIVRSHLPDDKETALKQRKRWEHGGIQTLLTQSPRLIASGIIKFKPKLVVHAIDISIPPLTLLVIFSLSLTAVSLLLALLNVGNIPLYISAIIIFELIITIFIAWVGWGKQILSFQELLKIPLYIAWKIPLYFSFITNREKKWVRTEREKK